MTKTQSIKLEKKSCTRVNVRLEDSRLVSFLSLFYYLSLSYFSILVLL